MFIPVFKHVMIYFSFMMTCFTLNKTSIKSYAILLEPLGSIIILIIVRLFSFQSDEIHSDFCSTFTLSSSIFIIPSSFLFECFSSSNFSEYLYALQHTSVFSNIFVVWGKDILISDLSSLQTQKTYLSL